MNKKLFYLVLFLIIGIIACKTGQKNNQESFNLDMVEEDYFFPEELIYNRSVSEVLVDKFYPIGFSKNGNFAYIVEYADEGLGNYMFGLVITNLVNNEEVWSWFTDPIVDKQLYREETWQKNYKTFKDKMNKYGLTQIRNIKMRDLYFSHSGNDFVVRLETKTQKDPDLNIDLVSKSDIFIKSPQLGEKHIISIDYEFSMYLGQQLAGCIISPFEDRVVIVLKNERWGYEGPPNVVEFEIYGTNLTTGFVK